MTLCCYADEALDYRKYIESRWLPLRRTNPEAADDLGDERDSAFNGMRAFVDLVATLPVPINTKKGMTRQFIGWKSASSDCLPPRRR